MSFYRRWIVACTAGELIGIGTATGAALTLQVAIGEPESIGDHLLTLATFALAGAGAGLCFGGAQWFVLRRYADRPGRWIWIHMPVWALAMAGIFLGATLPDAHSSGWFIALTGAVGGVCGGLLLGTVTGLVARTLEPIGVAQPT